MGILDVRDAFADYAHVVSEELFAGSRAGEAPFLTIAIPTYRRPDLLAEAVASALDQDFERPFEVVVVDNDAESLGHDHLLGACPRIAGANFRYLRNRANLGLFGNHNRCVEAARGEWVSILHDDDLIDPSFARQSFAQIAADPTIDGLVCRKRPTDARNMRDAESWSRKIARKGIELATFGLLPVRRITARQLFWCCLIGNTVGLLVRRRDAIALGGFYTEDYPSADYYFYARFAERFTLCEFRNELASVRGGRNVSMLKATQMAALLRNYELRSAYAGERVPRWWNKLSGLVLARHITLQARAWKNGLNRAEMTERIGREIPRDRPFLLYLLRLVLRGF